MGDGLSVKQVLAQLEAKVALHREQQAFHERQEELHREQKTLHAAELGSAIESCEAFRAASAGLGELLEADGTTSPSQDSPDEELDLHSMSSLSPLIARIVEGKGTDEPFGATVVTKELHERWGAKLGRRVDSRTVSATLRRWKAAGKLKLVREGWSYSEALYTRR